MALPLSAAGQALRWRWLSPHGLQAFSRSTATTLLQPAGRCLASTRPRQCKGTTVTTVTPPASTGFSVSTRGSVDPTHIAGPAFAGLGNRQPQTVRRSLAMGATTALTCAPAVTRSGTRRRSTSHPPVTPEEQDSSSLQQGPGASAVTPADPVAPRGRSRSPIAALPSALSASPASTVSPSPIRPSPCKPLAPSPSPSSASSLTRDGTVLKAPALRSVPSAAAVRRVTAAALGTGGYAAAPTITSAAAGGAVKPAAPVPTRHIVAAVDPDLAGALAVVYWDELPGTGAEDPPTRATVAASASLQQARSAAVSGQQEQQEGSGEEAAGASDGEEEAELGDAEGDGGLWLPAPPPPPADRSRWAIRVWDMPVSAAERQKPTASGGVSRRRLLHVAGARAVLASALRFALPPREARCRVALYGYVEVPPILPGDGNIAAYTSLWSTGAWLGLLAGMGFTVGSTPVRRWKTDLGLFGARSKDAGLTLARNLFPEHARILQHKKNHGRADALLIAAWALGASLPPRLAGTLRRNRLTVDELLAEHPGVGLAWGEPRPPAPTDAYGNLLTPEQDMMDEIEAAQSKVDKLDAAKAAAAERRTAKTSGTTRRSRKKAGAEADVAGPDVRAVSGVDGQEVARLEGSDGTTSDGSAGRQTASKQGRSGRTAGPKGAAAAKATEEELQAKEAAAPSRKRRVAPAADAAEQGPSGIVNDAPAVSAAAVAGSGAAATRGGSRRGMSKRGGGAEVAEGTETRATMRGEEPTAGSDEGASATARKRRTAKKGGAVAPDA